MPRRVRILARRLRVPDKCARHVRAHPPQVRPTLKRRFLETAPDAIRRYWARERPIELRPVSLQGFMAREPGEPVRHVWMRVNGGLPADQALHRCVLAYASDMMILDTALLAHGRSVFEESIQAASLDHALWFHRPFDAGEWLLYSQDSPATAGARGFTRGSVFTREGVLVASVAQEGLIRRRDDAR